MTKEIKQHSRDYYTDALEKLEDQIYSKNVHQVTIDLVQECAGDFRYRDDMSLEDLKGSWHYTASNLLEVLNPTLGKDVDIIEKLVKLLEG